MINDVKDILDEMNDLYANRDSDGEKALDLNYLLTTS